jgi:Arc/MetJ-type ribon-helix-helix transcriptional regulator
MERLTIRVPEELAEAIEKLADDDDVSESEAARRLLRRGTEHDRLTTENDQLRKQLQATNARQEDVGELVEYVEEERAMQRRERERRDAPLWRRVQWFVFGRD